MTLEDKIKLNLEEVYGSYEDGLEAVYENKIIYEILTNTYDKKLEWATYNQVIIELKRNSDLQIYLKELLYRITDDEDPIDACVSVLTKTYSMNSELSRLYDKIKKFKK